MKTFGAALGGYILMFIVLFATLTAAYFALGTERTFVPGSYAVTPIWIAIFLFFHFNAGMVAGVVVAKRSTDRRAPLWLAGMILIFGILMAIPAVQGTVHSAARDGSLTNMQAMMQAQTPPWIQLLAPGLATLGALGGSAIIAAAGRRRA